MLLMTEEAAEADRKVIDQQPGSSFMIQSMDVTQPAKVDKCK